MKCSNAKSRDPSVGDKVLIKQPKDNKISTPFKLKPLQITHKKGSMTTAQNGERTVTRNSSFLKKLSSNIPVHPVPSDEEEQSTPCTETVESPTLTTNESPTLTTNESPTLTTNESPTVELVSRTNCTYTRRTTCT